MSEPETKPAPSLQIQGRWAWRALPVVALLTLLFLWDTRRAVSDAEFAARTALLHQHGVWSLIETLTGTTLGR